MFTKITEERAFDGILAQIIENIRRGELKPGDTLPAERVMAESLGVSRPAVRDQIKIEYSYLILASLPDKCRLSGFYDHLICAIFYVVLIFSVKSQIYALFLSNFTLEVLYIS